MSEKTVGERLEHLRAAHNYSLRKVGEAVNKSAGTVLRWEQGKSDPTRADLVNLAAFYNVDAVWLQWGTQPKTSEKRTKEIVSKLPLLSSSQLDHINQLIELLVSASKEVKTGGKKS